MPERNPLPLGTRFTRLTVVGACDERRRYGKSTEFWYPVRCDCGVKLEVRRNSLTGGNTRSCGCIKKELDKTRRKPTHGCAGTTTYRRWLGMRRRCNYPTDISYPNYGGRGIKVCERWNISFENFLVDMGECPDGYSLDRIDNDKDYGPGNCRWATRVEQNSNQKRNRRVVLNGETMVLQHAAKRLGIHTSLVYDRVRRRGETHQEALDHYASRPD